MKCTTTLPLWAAQVVNNPPPSGKGFHGWLFRATLALIRCSWKLADIQALLETTSAACGRHVPIKEIKDALANADNVARRGATDGLPQRKWPSPNTELIEAVSRDNGELVDLWEKSPIRIEDNEPLTDEVIDALYPGNPLLCCGYSCSNFATRPCDQWRGTLSKMQLIVPSPMKAATGLTRDGRVSAHSLANTGPRRFLVTEFDTGSVDQHAARLLHLGAKAPLALAVHSGGKSLHGWFYCAGQPEERLLHFMRYAASLGADPATWTRSQFVRMPDGVRDNGNRQTIFFFNPGVIR